MGGKTLFSIALLGIALSGKADEVPVLQMQYAKPSAQLSLSGASILGSAKAGSFTFFAGANAPLGDDQPEYPLQNKEVFLGFTNKKVAFAIKESAKASDLSMNYNNQVLVNIEKMNLKKLTDDFDLDKPVRGHASFSIPISSFAIKAVGGLRSTSELERQTLDFVMPQFSAQLLHMRTFYDLPLDARTPQTYGGIGLDYKNDATNAGILLRAGSQNDEKLHAADLHFSHEGTLDTAIEAQIREFRRTNPSYETRLHAQTLLHIGRGAIGIGGYEQSYGGRIGDAISIAGAGAEIQIPVGEQAMQARGIYEKNIARSEETSRAMLTYLHEKFSLTLGAQRNALLPRHAFISSKISPLGAIEIKTKNTIFGIEAGKRPAIRPYEKEGIYGSINFMIKR